MGKVFVGMNLEDVRHHEKPFEWGVEKAAELGYEYIEPMVHFGRELMSEAGYYHTVSMFDDPYRMRRAAREGGREDLRPAGPRAARPARRPRRVPEAGHPLRGRVRAPVVNTDEGIKAKWTTEDEDYVLMRYTLYEAA